MPSPPDRGDPVGYKSPPRKTRFKKGNDFGRRPRKSKKLSPATEIQKALDEKIWITVLGEKRRITIRQAIFYCLREEASKGTSWAVRAVERIVHSMPTDDPMAALRTPEGLRRARRGILVAMYLVKGVSPEEIIAAFKESRSHYL